MTKVARMYHERGARQADIALTPASPRSATILSSG